jgi:hypothetical protein
MEHRWSAECPADKLFNGKLYYNNQNKNKYHAKISNSRAHAADSGKSPSAEFYKCEARENCIMRNFITCTLHQV